MIELTQTLADPAGHVAKLIFEGDGAIAECVAYRYKDRGVVCFSVMSGCPIGCQFCGTGKKFIRNLTSNEMSAQIQAGLDWIGPVQKTQIMSMSMGEPMLNMDNVAVEAYHQLNRGYQFFLSTVGVNNFHATNHIETLAQNKRFGLQFSLHCPFEEKRRYMLGGRPDLLSIKEIVALADKFHKISGNPAYFNYICTGRETEADAQMTAYIVGDTHHLTCSVKCNTKRLCASDVSPAVRFGQMCGVRNWSTFDPAGQDTIGGGCGQLLYVQDFFKKA
jgi:23S rRNA (adenine2503-C2)-methyltransferase